MSTHQASPRIDADINQIGRLVEQLARAESELAAATAGKIDSIVDPAGQIYLLKEAQQALLRSESAAREKAALLGAIFDNAPDYIAFLDPGRRIRFVNTVWKGLPREAVLGADWLSFQLPDQADPLRRIFESVVSTGRRARWEGPGRGAVEGTTATYARNFAPVFENERVVGVVIVSRDVTAHKAAEAQLIAADRMVSLGILAAGVAHEINNPLAAVIANLQLAIRELETWAEEATVPSQLTHELTDARTAADRVRLIVRDLKIFSRAPEERLDAVDVERVLESTLRMAWSQVRHRARLVREYGRVPLVLAHESRLGQVFLNLVVNAAEAIPEGNSDGNVVRVSTSVGEDGRVHIGIFDSGPGIPLEVRARLFTPFFTTKPVGAGTGLGLSICQRIVASLGGTIFFESELGKGTEFRVILPMASCPDEPRSEPASAVPRARRRGRVLVVDDEEAVVNAAARILSEEHDVQAISEAPRALGLFQGGARFDVVLCDLIMPQMTGMDLHAEVARIDPEQAARFAFMTGGAFTARARAFLDSSENPRIEKPFDMQCLRVLVNGLIA